MSWEGYNDDNIVIGVDSVKSEGAVAFKKLWDKTGNSPIIHKDVYEVTGGGCEWRTYEQDPDTGECSFQLPDKWEEL